MDRVTLEITNSNTKGVYAALSHAWGSGSRFQTIKANYEEYQKGFPIDSLPRTFNEAVQVVQALGYKHIWIDALCIIQDDKDDLAKELPIMGDIYRHADLAIYAQNSRNSYSGFFHQRNAQHCHPCIVPITAITEQGPMTEQVTLSTTCNGPDYLESRGWILQERVLSSRCLMFGKQMAWACTMGEAQETRPALRDRPAHTKGSFLAIAENLRGVLFGSTQSARSQFDIWYTTVEEYGKKDLSFHSDNLKAISGLAALFHKSQKTTYLAGLWKEDLERGLAWYVRINDSRQCSKEPDGPSWSWASVGKIRVQFRSWTGVTRSVDTVGVEVVNTGCELDSNSTLNPFGRLQSGFLILRGVWKMAKIKYTLAYASERNRLTYGASIPGSSKPGDLRDHPRFPAQLVDPTTDEMVGDAALDRPWVMEFDSQSTKEVQCLLLHVQVRRSGYSGTALVLTKKTSGNVYERLGLAILGDEGVKWFGYTDENTQMSKVEVKVV